MNFFSSFDSKRPRVSSLESGSCEGEEAGEGDSEKGGTEAGEETASTEGEVIKEDNEKKGDEEVKVGEGKEGGEEGKGREEGKGGREWGVGGEELEDEGAGSEFQDLLGGGLVGEGRGRRRMRVHTVETLESCVHEVAVPPSLDYTPLFKPATKPAKQYSFILDPFQKEAILCIDNNQSVLVSAHTSAGKTVVAEYSIAVSLNMKQRVIYTTPIKALSNQKYREFCEQFEDVGLVTGDVTINPTASCLIMTTEILRNLLYHGSEILREVSWVIFDEIHYMRDKERGVVWEETLILLPHNVRFVFLSATIPNAREFAEWVAFLHDQPCHVVYTDFRPTPLQHYIFPVCGEGIHLVVDEAGQFLDKNFETAMKVLEGKPLAPAKGKGDVNCFKLIKMVMERNLAPAIVFSFSKKECEMYALQVAKMDFNTPEQKSCVDEIFKNAMIVLSDEDRALPQVENVLPLLRRGIGIHHGGLLPILKETIELLFAEGLIKALFATETFAMGLNMPARTVVFTGLRKFDGQEHRIITSGEYIQMSGRAGRRGLDEKGIVIVMMDEAVKPSVGKELVQGKADFLNSAFHLTYSMILNLMRVEGINPEYILERSFFQFQNRAKLPLFLDEYERLKKEISEIQIEDEKTMTKYYDIKTELEGKKEEMRRYVYQPFYAAPFLQPGRLVKMTGMEGEKYDWGVVLGHHGGKGRGSMKPDDGSDLTIDVIVAKAESQPRVQYRSPKYGWTVTLREVEVVSLPAANLVEISVLRIEQPKDMRKKEQRLRISKSLEEISKRFPEGIPVLDPRIDLKVDDSKLSAFEAEVRKYERKLEGVVEGKGPCDPKQFELYSKKRELRKEKEAVADRIKEAVSLIHMDELKRRKRVLRRLEYCTEKDVILMKGRVACELSSVDELVMTELLFSGVLNDLSPNEVTALLTVFVCDERSNETPKIPENLQMPLRKLKEITDRVLKTSVDAMLDLNEELYTSQFKPYLIQVVLSWTTGISFAEICKMTDFFEGSIIRCLRRLEELLRQLVQVAKKVGNVVLEAKFSTGITLIKRDIVFAASLYL